MHRVPSGKTVIVLLEVAGQEYGLPVAVVQDALKVSRAGHGAGWRVCSTSACSGRDARTIEVDGRVIPLVDLRERLGLPNPMPRSRSRMVVVVRSGERWLGLLVDTVAEIVEAPRSSIETPPSRALRHQPIGQVAHLGDRTVGLLDADHLLPTGLAAVSHRAG